MRAHATIFLFLALSVSCCGSGGNADTAATATQNENLATRPVTINASSGASIVTAEIADTDVTRRLGMMNRSSLAADAGMLFIFTEDVSNPFWMKDTYVSLDILFIGADKRVVTIAESTTILSEEYIYATAPYRYVLEVNAGYSDAHGVAVGDSLSFTE